MFVSVWSLKIIGIRYIRGDVRSVQGQERVRLLFRLRTGSAGLLKDKKRYVEWLVKRGM